MSHVKWISRYIMYIYIIKSLTSHTRDAGQKAVLGHHTIVHVHRSGAGRSHRHFSGYYGGRKASCAPFHHEPSDAAIIAPGPHHEYVGHRCVGYPRLGAVQYVRLGVRVVLGFTFHRPNVTSGVRFGQAKATHQVSGGKTRQVPFPLLFGAVRVIRVHDQRRLDAQGGSKIKFDTHVRQ